MLALALLQTDLGHNENQLPTGVVSHQPAWPSGPLLYIALAVVVLLNFDDERRKCVEVVGKMKKQMFGWLGFTS